MRICFVALEILGPFNGGGIATALAGQAEHHAKEHDVTVLYVHPALKKADSAKWESFYAQRNIRFIRADFDTFYPRDTIPKRSFAVKEYLQGMGEDFDVIFFHDYLGLGYYTALTRALGLGFENTHIVSSIHGPSEWARPLSMVRDTPYDINLYELERKQLEYSDKIVAPSQDIIDWCLEQGWVLPEDRRAISNLLPHRLDLHTGLKQGDVVEGIEEVCFFGRLETRKGFFTFLDAIKYLHKNQLTVPKKVTFLGGFCDNGYRNSASSVFEYAEHWDCEIQLLNNASHEEAISYLVENKPLTVLPSRDESFGLTAYECLVFGVPALISARGALRGLAAEPEREQILFEPTADILARRIAGCLDDGAVIGAVDPVHLSAETQWDKLLSDLKKAPKPLDPQLAVASLDPIKTTKKKPKDKEPLVSVIVAHHNRPEMLADALESLLAQTYKNLEIVISDDGSLESEYVAVLTLVEGLNDKRIKVIRQENRYLGAARNFGVEHSTGSYLLFMDDDNYAMPEEIATFVKVALATDADVLNTVSKMFYSDEDGNRKTFDIYTPAGPSLQLAILGNTFGDANSLVKRSVFEELGGFTEKYAVGCEDYEFFTRAFLSGKKMQVVPELLFDYRSEADGMMKELNSGKYIVNQLRGVTAMLDTHRQIDLAQVRGLLRLAFHSAVTDEYNYWLDEGVKRRKHEDLERELAGHHGNPNGREVCEIVARILTADGKMVEAMNFLARNNIVPTNDTLVKLRDLYDRYEAQNLNGVAQHNIIVNPAFEFWTLGSRFEGTQPYQYIANEWLLPSPKERPNLIVSQRTDSVLFTKTNTRTNTYLHMQMNAPDPDGYLFVSQRNYNLANALEKKLELSMLTRASYHGELNVFLRVTYDPETAHLYDIHPQEAGYVSTEWKRVNYTFDLTDFKLSDMQTDSFLSLFVAVPVDNILSVDLADITLLHSGATSVMAPYVSSVEGEKSNHRCFMVGRDARIEVTGDGNIVTLNPIQSEKVAQDSRLYILAPLVVLRESGDFFETTISEARFHYSEAGKVELILELEDELPESGVVFKDCIAVTNYREG